MSHKIWFITGASTGFGRILAEELLKSGNKVVATARKMIQMVAEIARGLVAAHEKGIVHRAQHWFARRPRREIR